MVEQTGNMMIKLRVKAAEPDRSSYISSPSWYDWHAHTHDRLRWAHGDQRAADIVLGRDAATNADLKAWRELGRC